MDVLRAPSEQLDKYLQQQSQKTLVRFITCGSVDDGKSTLIGRLLYESKSLYSDQLTGLKKDSFNFAALLDGLSAEQEQGITIDLAYRYFDSTQRKYIVIDAPGHEQYTKNMVTGASIADVAVILIDARHGLKEQSRRHCYLVSLLGIKQIIVLINKMDLVDYSPVVYHQIVDDCSVLFERCAFKSVSCIPISALQGDNIVHPGTRMPWYPGLPFLQQMDHLILEQDTGTGTFKMPVQTIIRPQEDRRSYAGRIVSGLVALGQTIKVAASGQTSRITEIYLYTSTLTRAQAGQSVSIRLEDDIDISRGDVLIDAEEQVTMADQFQTHVIWFSEQILVAGRCYLVKNGAHHSAAQITKIKHRININTLEAVPAQSLAANDIGLCTIKLDAPIVYDTYKSNRHLGSFILIDRMTHETVGAGLIQHVLQRSGNIPISTGFVNQQVRALIKNQQPRVLWLTGLSGAGKSTIAHLLEQRLVTQGHHTFVLDGDNVRQGLCNDLGFTVADRVENVRRVAETAKLMLDAGLIVIVALISPYKRDRAFARNLFQAEEFVEVFVHASLSTVQTRDVKGLYCKAHKGMITNFTGIDSDYESPEQPEIIINTEVLNVDQSVDLILDCLKAWR